MVPRSTLDILGVETVCRQAIRHRAHSVYSLEGWELNDIEALVMRLNDPRSLDFDERRDWANRLRVLIDRANIVLEM